MSRPVSEPRARDPWSPPCVPGDTIDGKYRIERLLGSGGMAWVFQATHLALEQPVALKFLRVDPATDNTAALARFDREARAAASIPGEATARVLDVGALDDGSPFMVMECLDGRDLESVVERGDRLPVGVAVGYALQACEGLAETHAAGVVHRDLKPANLFLTRTTDGTPRVKLLDFGVSKFLEPSRHGVSVTSTQALVGSPIYMSPEQLRSSRSVDHRTDIWSMGVILYELLAEGRSPFGGITLPEICARILDQKPAPLATVRRDVPRALEAVVRRCLDKDPARRFQTAADLADALAPFGAEDARCRADRVRKILGARASRSFDRVRPRVRPRALAAGAMAAALATFALVLGAPAAVPSPAPVSAAVRSARSAVLPAPEVETAIEALAPPAPEVQREVEVTTAPAPAASGAPAPARVAARSDFDIPEFGGRE